MKKNLLVAALCSALFILSSCSSDSSDSSDTNSSSYSESKPEDDPYFKLHVVFVGMPEEDEIKPMMEAVMTTHNFTVNDENIIKFGSMLLTLRKNSKVGVTEMDILKHMYQNGSALNTIGEQGGISSYYLEKTK